MATNATQGHWLKKFTLDTRSAGLFRIMLALIVLYDLIYYRITSFDLFYSTQGIVPVDYCYKQSPVAFLSPYYWFNNDAASLGLLYFSVAIFVLYLLGIGLKVVKPLGWYLYLSVLLRNLNVEFGYNIYTDHALFWAMFLPLGNHFTVLKSKQPESANPLAVFAAAAQVALLYFTTAVAKYGDSWLKGFAVRNMVVDITFDSPMQKIILNSPPLYTFLTYSTLVAEYLIPVLLIWSFFRKDNGMRYAAIGLIYALHTGILMFSDVGTFSYISITMATLFLPAAFWVSLGKRVKRIPAMVAKPFAEIKWVNYILYVAIGGMVFMNVMFYIFHTPIKKGLLPKGQQRYWLDTRSFPLKDISPFGQHWGMYAPNPMSNVGWITLEYQTDTLQPMRNLFNDAPALPNKPVYKPAKLETYFLYFARTWPSKKNQHDMAVFWAKYHINKFKNTHPELLGKAKIYVVNYFKIITLQKNIRNIPFTKQANSLQEFETLLDRPAAAQQGNQE